MAEETLYFNPPAVRIIGRGSVTIGQRIAGSDGRGEPVDIEYNTPINEGDSGAIIPGKVTPAPGWYWDVSRSYHVVLEHPSGRFIKRNRLGDLGPRLLRVNRFEDGSTLPYVEPAYVVVVFCKIGVDYPDDWDPEDPDDPFNPWNPGYPKPPPETKYTVTTTSDPPEGGSTSGGGEFSYGDTCTIYATPNDDYEFEKWTGLAETQSQTYSFPVYQDSSWTAHFRYTGGGEDKVSIMYVPVPAEGGETSGSGLYDRGEVANLLVEANEGWICYKSVSSRGQVVLHTPLGVGFVTAEEDVTWYAYFRQHTHKILRDASGKILVNAAGEILRDD